MAQRQTLGYFQVGQPETEAATECRDCGFDAVLRFPLTLLTDSGVTPSGYLRACARCYDEQGEAQ